MSFVHLLITVEGQTEEHFVKQVLNPYLRNRNIMVQVHLAGTSKVQRGGLGTYEKTKRDLIIQMKTKQNSECWFTTMFDFYRLPNSFPGYENAQKIYNPYGKVKALEKAFKQDISHERDRFIPYIQLHEFEALILSDPACLKVEYIDQHKGIQQLINMVQNEGGNPELINGNYDTAPSRRIEKAIKGYKKKSGGSIIAEAIGLDTMRAKCRHFNDWVTQLENLAGA